MSMVSSNIIMLDRSIEYIELRYSDMDEFLNAIEKEEMERLKNEVISSLKSLRDDLSSYSFE